MKPELPVPAVPDPPPSPPGLPLLGHVLDYAPAPYLYCERAIREYGDVVKFDFADHPLLLLAHPLHVQQVLVTHNKRTRKDEITRAMVAFLGEGLLTADNTPALRKQRRISAALLGTSQVTRYAPAIVAQAQGWVEGLSEGQAVDLHHEMTGLALLIGAETLFGLSLAQEVEPINEELEAFLAYFRAYGQGWQRLLPAWMPTPLRRRVARMLSRFDARLERLIQERREAGERSDDVLRRLINARDDAEGGLSEQQLRDDATTLLLAGHETTALNLGFTLMLLGQHPEALARLTQELDEALGGAPVTAETARDMPWLDAVLRESLRLYPPAWGMGREVIEPFELGGYTVPAGVALLLSPWVTQRDARWFPEPARFRPERWLDGSTEGLPKFAFFPFGGGGRLCVGMHFALLEAKLCLATALQRATFEVDPGFAPALESGVTLRPTQGLPARVRLRGAG